MKFCDLKKGDLFVTDATNHVVWKKIADGYENTVEILVTNKHAICVDPRGDRVYRVGDSTYWSNKKTATPDVTKVKATYEEVRETTFEDIEVGQYFREASDSLFNPIRVKLSSTEYLTLLPDETTKFKADGSSGMHKSTSVALVDREGNNI